MARKVNIDPGDIVRAARTCIQENGFSATTLKDVAARAGVTQGTVYYHFKTKEELFAAVMDLTNNENLIAIEKAMDKAVDVHSKISTVMDVTREVYGRNEEFRKLFFNLASLALHNERASEEFTSFGRKTISIIESMCRKAYEGQTDTLIQFDHLARILSAVVTGLALQSMFLKEIDIDAVYGSFSRILQQAVGNKAGGGEEPGDV
ncbi:MAG: TetR/AcrR family transcriptional regulator [Actinobacteria bacterium]|nr:TetR/AcrR family transcriptional regulator [Actinomycetota bacterium]